MENVSAFNIELSGLYESKPPISKAKMAAITKSAMRAIKFYKHVVQSVEKFILKCKPEYKVPGLYVIDSIVRQSRHQFGPDKDVFAPRFARNIKETFANLFRCAPEDKSRIIRVLNLWQKNNVFAPEVIQPIFDLADPSHPIYSMPMPPGGNNGSGAADISTASNGLNISSSLIEMNHGASAGTVNTEDKLAGLPDLSNNNLKQLLNDPNVLRQLQTLQNFQKFKQQEEKYNDLRSQEEAFEKHLQTVLMASSGQAAANQDPGDVQFVSEEQKIEVINLDGNDSRSPSAERDRYKRRRSRSRSRERNSSRRDRDRRRNSRSRSRSPRSIRRRSSRDRERSDRNLRDKEKDREHERERRRKGLPDIKKEHLSVCSTTLWVGHLSKLVYQEELSDTFGEYGDIVSIDQIVPRGCAFIVMNRRQDAHKAMQCLKNHKLQGRVITISWAAGKGVKSKEWKDFWDLELGVTYIPWNKLDESINLDDLEEGGMFDEDTMPTWMKENINKMKLAKEKHVAGADTQTLGSVLGVPAPAGIPLYGIDTTQPPPGAPPLISMMQGQYTMGAPHPIGPPPRVMGHMGIPLPNIGIPPNINMGPPNHTMILGGMNLPPGFPPMPGPGTSGAPPPPLMGLPPPQTSFPPPPSQQQQSGNIPLLPVAGGNIGDDHMDIDMDDDHALSADNSSGSKQPISFAEQEHEVGNEIFSRDRNRVASRWGGRGVHGLGDEDSNDKWINNGMLNSFPDSRIGGGNNRGMPDFINEFERGNSGPHRIGHRGGNNGGGDFYSKIGNRFNQPTNLMQMRIAPPNAFNQRMGGPGGPPGPHLPMFMRGQGGRQQAPGFYNPRNPFDRADNMNRGGGKLGARGGRGAAIGGSHRDNCDEEDDFRRPGQRFRGDGPDDRRDRGGRRGGRGGAGERDFRGNRDYNDRERSGGNRSASFSGSKREDPKSIENADEEDWDKELEDFDTKEINNSQENKISVKRTNSLDDTSDNFEDRTKSDIKESNTTFIDKPNYEYKNPFGKPNKNVNTNVHDSNYKNEKKNDPKKDDAKETTPLYDEVPPPKHLLDEKPPIPIETAPKLITPTTSPVNTTTEKEVEDFSREQTAVNIQNEPNIGTLQHSPAKLKSPSSPRTNNIQDQEIFQAETTEISTDNNV